MLGRQLSDYLTWALRGLQGQHTSRPGFELAKLGPIAPVTERPCELAKRRPHTALVGVAGNCAPTATYAPERRLMFQRALEPTGRLARKA
jgi:hypothetical protein